MSILAKDLDEQVEQFRTRPLHAGPYTFVAADAVMLKVREDGRVADAHALLATGVNKDGHREILSLQVTSAEDGAGWIGSFRDLTVRGLTGVELVTSGRSCRPHGRHRGDPARRDLAALPHPLRRKSDVRDPEIELAVGEDPAPLCL